MKTTGIQQNASDFAKNEDVPGDHEADEDVPDEAGEAHGDVGHGQRPQYVIIHPANNEINKYIL